MSGINNAINANSNTPLNTTDGGTGVSSPTSHGVMVGEGSSAVNPIVLSAGQILVGTTSGDPTPTTITAGAGISITSVSGVITISIATAPPNYVVVSTSTQAMTSNNCYIITYSGTPNLSLPSTSSVGDIIQVMSAPTNYTAAWNITQGAGQVITFGASTATTVGTGGSVNGVQIYMICVVANTTWSVLSEVNCSFM